MQRPSYPKETADQWPPIAGDHTGRGGACNQSINAGRSLGEQYNLMRHTPTHLPPYLISSSSSSSPSRPSPSSRNLFFFSSSVYFCRAPITTKQSSASPLLRFPPSSLNPPPPMTSLKFRGDGTHKREECCRAGAGKSGETAVQAVREIDGFW